MRIAFQDYEIRKICEDADYAGVTLGPAMAKVLQLRLADLEAAPTIADLPIENRGVIAHKPYSLFYVELAKNLHLIFKADHIRRPPIGVDNDIDWNKVTYIQVLEIQKTNA